MVRPSVYTVKKDGHLRASTIQNALSSVDEDEHMTAKVIFEMFDVDASGHISYEEYARLHEALIKLVKDEHQKEAQLATEVASANQSTRIAMEKSKRANRRTKVLACTSFVLIIFLLISTGLNIASQLYIGELQKDTFIDAEGHMSIKKTGKVASMEAAHFEAKASTLFGHTDADLNAVDIIKVTDAYGMSESYRIVGFSRRADSVIFYTARGIHAVQVDSTGQVTLVDPSSRRHLQKLTSKTTFVSSSQLLSTTTASTPQIRSREYLDDCKPSGNIEVGGTTDSERKKRSLSAEVVTNYLITSEWTHLPNREDIGVVFNESQGSTNGVVRRLQTSTPFDQLKNYYVAEAQNIFQSGEYPGMCYTNAYLEAQLNWCVSQGYAIGVNNYTAVISCVEDYFASLDANGNAPSALDPTNSGFGCPTSARRRLTGDGASCHPAHATVELASGATSRLDALRVGDEIRTPTGFEPVVGFLHADAKAYTSYHVLTTDGGRTIEISDNHWLMIDDIETDPTAAKVGQRLTTTEGEQTIVSISKAARAGAYHLVTASGQYYVDGVLASTYVAYVPRKMWSVFGDGYFTLRYALGVPIVPDGQSAVPLFWFLDAMKALAIPAALQVSVFWLPLVASVVLSELASALVAHLPMTTSILAIALPALVVAAPMTKRRATA